MKGLRAVADVAGVRLLVEGVPMAFLVAPVARPEDGPRPNADQALRFAKLLADFGIWTTTRGIWFVSARHADPELELTLARFAEALDAGLKSGELDWLRQ
jgi:glutamate-1-semialdehyde 2,1-aminomutase